MIVFDLFTGIESKHQIKIYFSDFHDLMCEYPTVLVKVETAVQLYYLAVLLFSIVTS